MTIPLSPARGETWASGDQGAPPSAIRGARVVTPTGVELQLVNNGNGGVLSGCRAVAWRSIATHEVQLTSGLAEQNVAGVVDPMYAEKGVTVEDGANFWIVKRGATYVLTGAAVAAGEALSSHTTDGTVAPNSVGLSVDATKVIGYALEAAGSDASVRAMLNLA